MIKTCLISSGRCGTQLIHTSLREAGYNVIGEPIGHIYNNLPYKDLAAKYGVNCQDNLTIDKLCNKEYVAYCFDRADMLSILYYTLTPEIKQYLVDQNIRIIHVKRRNHLLRFLSLEHAFLTTYWVTKVAVVNQPIYLDPIKFLYNLAYNRGFEKEINNFGTNIYYEDFSSSELIWNNIIEKIIGESKFINLATKKIITQHPYDMILNIGELMTYPEIKVFLEMCL